MSLSQTARPILAPAYIYGLLVVLVPVCAVIDAFVAPAIHWPAAVQALGMAALFAGFLVFFAHRFGGFAKSPLWVRAVRITAEAMMLANLMTYCLPLLDHMVKIPAAPLADPWLAAADAWMGFDWMAVFQFVHDTPALAWVLDVAYEAVGVLTLVIVVGFVLLHQPARARFCTECLVLCSFLSIVISGFAPAYAAAVYYGIDFAQFPNFAYAPGVYHVENLTLMRAGRPDLLVGAIEFKGLITFPSFHTAMALVMAGCAWRHWAFLPLAIYAVLVVASTPVYGSHYLVDVIGGTVLALTVMRLVASRASYRGTFAADGPSAVRLATG